MIEGLILMENQLILEQIQIGPMQNFTYLVGDRNTMEVTVVDPAWDIPALTKLIEEKGYTLTSTLITHYHPDHCGGSFGSNKVQGIADLLETHSVKSYVNKIEADGIKKVTGVSDNDLVKVESGDKLKVGDIEIEFLHTPGHTPGSQCFRIKNTLVSGDTLFINGCGRVDLPGSNSEDMFHSIQKLCSLPDDTLLLPGHNYADVPNATMADTKKVNPYLRVKDLEQWRMFMG